MTLKHGVARAARRGDGGAIVVMASLNSWRAAPSQAAYTASKHAVLGHHRARRRSTSARTASASTRSAPGPSRPTALLERLEPPRRRGRAHGRGGDRRRPAARNALGRMVTEDEVATTALFLASDLSSGITGQLVPVDGGMR